VLQIFKVSIMILNPCQNNNQFPGIRLAIDAAVLTIIMHTIEQKLD